MLALFWFTIRQTILHRRIWLSVLLLAGPSALILLVRRFEEADSLNDVWERFHASTQILTFNVIIPLVCILHGTALLGAEVEGRTVLYLITRKMRRATVLVVKLVAAGLALTVLVELSLLVQYACAVAGIDVAALPGAARAAPWSPGHEMLCYLRVAPLGVFAFTALFVLVSLLTVRPLAASVLYFVIVELVVGNLPIGARAYSITHQLRRSMYDSIPGLGRIYELSAEQLQFFFPPGSSGAPTLVIFTLLVLGVAGFLVTTRELVPTKIAHE